MTDLIGGIACILVLVTFCMRDMSKLRLIAIVSNVAFIVYAVKADLMPVLALHSILLPINLLVIQSMRGNDEINPLHAHHNLAAKKCPLPDFYRVHATQKF